MLQVKIYNEDEDKLVFDGRLKTAIIAGMTEENNEGNIHKLECTFAEATTLEIAKTIICAKEAINGIYKDDISMEYAVKAIENADNGKFGEALFNILKAMANEDEE